MGSLWCIQDLKCESIASFWNRNISHKTLISGLSWNTERSGNMKLVFSYGPRQQGLSSRCPWGWGGNLWFILVWYLSSSFAQFCYLPDFCQHLTLEIFSWSPKLTGERQNTDIQYWPLPHPPELWMSPFCIWKLVIQPPQMKCYLPSHIAIPSVINSPWRMFFQRLEWGFHLLSSPTLGWRYTHGALIWFSLPSPNMISTAFPRAQAHSGLSTQHVHCDNFKSQSLWCLLIL